MLVRLVSFVLCNLLLVSARSTHHKTRIVNGKSATSDQFPYMVMLRSNTFVFCGGSIISSRYILTAAHCIKTKNASDVNVLVGSISQKDGGTRYNVAQLIPHPSYTRSPLENDIGLIKLSSDITFNTQTQAVDLNSKDVYTDYTDGIVSGWGLQGSDKDISTTLLYAEVSIVPETQCSKIKTKPATNEVCAAGKVSGSGFCSGDSGGPFVSNSKQIGVVSAFLGKCGSNPDIYTRVDKFYQWITDTIAN